MNLIKKHWPLLLIFAIALVLRLYRLGTLPITFHEDELLSGYLGRYILQNGFDLYGNKWPLLYFNKFGDYYIILPMYLSGLSSLIFGVGEFATRLPAALTGSLTVLPIYYITNSIFHSKRVGYIAAFLTAITPWFIVLSRSTTEGVIGSLIFLSAIALLLCSINNKDKRFLLTAAGLCLLSYFIYHPFRLYTPAIFIAGSIIYFKQLNNKQFRLLWLAVTIAFMIFTLYISTVPWGKGRFIQTSIFSDLSGVKIKTQELIFSEGNNNILKARIFHNKIIGYGQEFANQYLTYFSPIYLLINSGPKLRYYVPQQGLLYFSYIIFAVGLIFAYKQNLYKKLNKNHLLFFLFLLFISPIPAAFTVAESPNPHRSLLFGYLLIIAIAGGLGYFVSLKKYISYHLGGVILFIFLFLEFIFFWHQYSNHSDLYSSLARNDPQKQVAKYLLENKGKYMTIYAPVEGTMAWYYLLYKKYFSPKYSNQFQLDARIDKIDNIDFIDSTCPTETIQIDTNIRNVLIINRYNCPDNTLYKNIDKITGVNHMLGFKVYTIN